MGRIKNDGSNLKPRICKGATLREENLGKKDVDVSSILKIKHLKKLAAWAGGEGGIPPLGAFFGYHLAAKAEALGVPLDKSSFFCQRCESILQPGFNCTIRIKKCDNNKQRQSNKSCNSQNNVIYMCNSCHHPNLIKGTTKGHIKNLSSLKLSRSDPTSASKQPQCSLNETTAEKLQTKTPVTPQQKSAVSSKNKRKLSELDSGKLQLSSSSAELSCSGKGSSRRKRKTWSSLNDIVVRKEAKTNQNVSNYVIPFYMQSE